MSKRTLKRKNVKVATEPTQQDEVEDPGPEKVSMVVGKGPPTVNVEKDDGHSPIMQLLIEKNKWQQKLIADLENERDFLRRQLSATASGSTCGNLSAEIKEPIPKVLSSSSCSSSEDESSSSQEKKSKKKRRREKQRTGRARKPEEVIKRYKDVLKTFRKLGTMSAAFHRHGLDRGTIASTASIAELAIADPGFYQDIKKSNKETLLDFAKRCNAMMSGKTKQKIEEMKHNNELIPLQHTYN